MPVSLSITTLDRITQDETAMTRRAMNEQQISHVDSGQVHLMMIEFPPGTPPFNVEMAAELMRLQDVGLIRILDLLVVLKDDAGRVRGCEATSVDGLDIRRLEGQLPRVLAADDVSKLAEPLDPGATAGVVVWGDTWVAPLASAAGRAAEVASVTQAALESRSSGGVGTGPGWGPQTWEPLSPRRNRPSVLRGSVARTAGLPPGSKAVPRRSADTGSGQGQRER